MFVLGEENKIGQHVIKLGELQTLVRYQIGKM